MAAKNETFADHYATTAVAAALAEEAKPREYVPADEHSRLKVDTAYVVATPIYWEVHQERIRAHNKHGAKGNSREDAPGNDPQWLAILGEEYGEVCHALTYDSGGTTDELRGELIQVAAMATAWIAAIDAAEKEQTA